MMILMISLLWMLYVKGDVQISVSYGQESSHQCLHDNDDVTLTCRVNPLTTVIDWYHDTTFMQYCSNLFDKCKLPGGTTYPRHSFSSSISNGMFALRINPVSPGTDAGIYRCAHGGAADSDSVTLDACGDVQISVTYGKEPSHQCIHDNGDVTLTCTVNPLENIVEWLHGSTRMVTCSSHLDNTCFPYGGADTFPRHTFSSDVSNKQFTLHVDSVIPGTDAGVYVCEHGGYTDSASVTLDACGDVQISVTYGQGPSHQCLHNNDDVTLTCTINPLSNVVKWYHDTTKMVTCSNIKDYCVIIGGTSAYPRHNFTSSFANGEFTLRINPVSPGTDAGIYKCEHGGPSDGDSVSIEACVQVTGAQLQKNGVIINSGPLEVNVNKPTTLTCNVLPTTRKPVPTIVWYIGSTVKQSSTEFTYTFTASATNHDQVIYCEAYNIQFASQAVGSAKPKLYVRVPVTTVQMKKDNIAFNGATLTTTADSTVSLSCTPGFSRPSPPTIDWYIGSVLKLSDSVQYRYTAEANDHTKLIFCQAYIPRQTIKAVSNKQMLNINVEGVRMSIVPSTVLLDYVSINGDEQPTNTFFTCGGITETDVQYIQSIKIYRLTRNDLPSDSGVGPVVATIDAITRTAEIIIDELKSRATVYGNIDTTVWTQSTLVVTFETVQLQCKDEGMYTCAINYETTGSVIRSARDSTNLTTNAKPANISMTASKYGMQISQFTGNVDSPELVKEGDVLQFKCTGLLGNLPDAKIMWMRTSLTISSDELIDMKPGVTSNDGSEITGAIIELPDQCSRLQTNTLTYVIQSSDTRKETLAFKCYIEATPPQSATGGIGVKIKVNSKGFYMRIATSTEIQANSAGGVIAGGVTAGVLVIIIILVSVLIFVYLRRKGQNVHSQGSTSIEQNLGPMSYEGLSHTRESIPAYDNIGATTHADQDSSNGETTYEGLQPDITPAQAYASLNQENNTNTEIGASTYTNLTLN